MARPERPLEVHAQEFLEAEKQYKDSLRIKKNKSEVFKNRTGNGTKEHILSFIK